MLATSERKRRAVTDEWRNERSEIPTGDVKGIRVAKREAGQDGAVDQKGSDSGEDI
jgi:hypothetical protein